MISLIQNEIAIRRTWDYLESHLDELVRNPSSLEAHFLDPLGATEWFSANSITKLSAYFVHISCAYVENHGVGGFSIFRRLVAVGKCIGGKQVEGGSLKLWLGFQLMVLLVMLAASVDVAPRAFKSNYAITEKPHNSRACDARAKPRIGSATRPFIHYLRLVLSSLRHRRAYIPKPDPYAWVFPDTVPIHLSVSPLISSLWFPLSLCVNTTLGPAPPLLSPVRLLILQRFPSFPRPSGLRYEGRLFIFIEITFSLLFF